MKLIDKHSPNHWSEYRINGNEVTVHHKEDVTFLKDTLKNLGDDKADSAVGRHMAKIPLTIYTELCMKGIANDPVRFKRWLNDPDNRVWRVSGGKI